MKRNALIKAAMVESDEFEDRFIFEELWLDKPFSIVVDDKETVLDPEDPLVIHRSRGDAMKSYNSLYYISECEFVINCNADDEVFNVAPRLVEQMKSIAQEFDWNVDVSYQGIHNTLFIEGTDECGDPVSGEIYLSSWGSFE